MTEVREVPTPGGPARAHLDLAPRSRLTLLLGHGAGGGVDAPDLVALATALPERGIDVVRVEAPWRVAGRRVAGPPASLDLAWSSVLTEIRPDLPGPWVLGGRSAGARVACRTAPGLAAATSSGSVVGVLALAFPLVPPGRRVTRLPELLGAGVPTLVVQGERDPFGRPEAFMDLPPAYAVIAVPGADHSFRVSRAHDQHTTLAAIVDAVAHWVGVLGESLPGGRG